MLSRGQNEGKKSKQKILDSPMTFAAYFGQDKKREYKEK
jgi:hypothetical protein